MTEEEKIKERIITIIFEDKEDHKTALHTANRLLAEFDIKKRDYRNSFDKFCDEQKIHGNFREGLYHSVMAHAKDPNNVTEEELSELWKNFLEGILRCKDCLV